MLDGLLFFLLVREDGGSYFTIFCLLLEEFEIAPSVLGFGVERVVGVSFVEGVSVGHRGWCRIIYYGFGRIVR